MENWFEIGKIVNTQGVKGDVRVVPSTFDIKRFELLKKVTIYKEDKEKTLEIERVWYHKKFVIIKFKEIKNMNDAETLRDYIIKISDEESLPLEDDEYYIRDLVGIEVYTKDEKLGNLVKVIETGANDVYVVKGEKEILIPAIKKCILNIDLQNKRMDVNLLEGL